MYYMLILWIVIYFYLSMLILTLNSCCGCMNLYGSLYLSTFIIYAKSLYKFSTLNVLYKYVDVVLNYLQLLEDGLCGL